jgi:transposase
MILAERAARIAAEAQAAEASAVRQGLTLEIERLKLEIARLRRERFGPSAERSARLEQLELYLEDLEEAAAEADAAQAALLHGSGRWRPGPGWSSRAALLLTPGCPPCPSS